MFDKFILYKVEVENQLSRKVKRVKYDRGGKCISYNDFCDKEGIIHEVNPLYFPQWNRVAERKNRTLKEMMSLLVHMQQTTFRVKLC